MDLENLTFQGRDRIDRRTVLKVILAGSLVISSSNYQSPAYPQEKNLQENEETSEKKDYSLEEFLELPEIRAKISPLEKTSTEEMDKKWMEYGKILRKSFYEIYANPEKYLKKIKGNRILGESFEKFDSNALDEKERKFYENFVFWNIDYKNLTTGDRILLHTLYVGTRANLFQDGFRVFGN